MFEKTSILPFVLALLLDQIQHPVAELVDNSLKSTLLSCCAVYRMHKAYRKSLTKKWLSLIFHANERLAAQHSINQYTISGLVTLLKHEKKKRS